MRAVRRLLQVIALVGTLLVGVLAVALIVSQTPWFKDWLRRYVVRESKQYLNGELSIGRLGGNLLFGVSLSDIAVDLSGERVIAARSLDVDYSVFQLISKGLVVDGITLDRPVVVVERDGDGWNLGRLVKEEEKEAGREGPGRSISLPSIVINEASVSITDQAAPAAYRLPRRIEGLDIKAGFEYEPVQYTIDIDHLRFLGSSPQIALEQLSGRVAVREDDLYLDDLSIHTGRTALKVDGFVEDYLRTPVVKLTVTGQVSLQEMARVFPAAAGYDLNPSLKVAANGPADRLALDLDVRSEAGQVKGQVTADVQAPGFGVEGNVSVDRLDLAPILRNPEQRTDLTGDARLDLRLAARPANAPAVDRLAGTFTFAGPRVVAAGYEARDVTVAGELNDGRMDLDGRVAAYGGTATARGFILMPAGERQLSLDLRGAADGVDLRKLPASVGAPQLDSRLSIAEYHVAGAGRTFEGRARLNRSTVEGSTIAPGTTVQFGLTPSTVSYSARGSITDLDLQRVGQGLRITALTKPEFGTRIQAAFDVSGSVPRDNRTGGGASALARMTLDASATLTDSDLMGGTLPSMIVETSIDRGALRARAEGEFKGFNPARLSGRREVEGSVSGRVNASVQVEDLTAPVTPEAIEADGTVTLDRSVVGGLQIEGAEVTGQYASQIADLNTLTVTGPDVQARASGRLALDRTSASNLEYHIDAVNVPELARLAGQPKIGGAAILDGTITGNAASLTLTGTLDGSNLSYEKNNVLDLNSRYTVTVPDLQFARAKVEAATDATFVAAVGMRLNSVTAKTTYTDKQVDFTANIKEKTRELDASGQLVLHQDHQELHLPNFAVRTQGIEWRSAPGTEAAIQYGAGRITLENVRLVSGDQEIEVTGALALADGGTRATGATPAGALEVHARNVDLQQLERLLLQNRGLSGRLTADATVSGSTSTPAIDGRVEIRDGGFQGYRYESLSADIDYRGNRVGVDATLQQSPTESITVKGTVPRSLFTPTPGPAGEHLPPTGDDSVDLRIQSSALNLAVIQGVTTQVANVSGTLQADVRVTGSGADPHFEGYVDIRNGAFGVPAGGVSYTGLDTRIELDTDRVRLQEFSIRDAHGEPLTVAGDLAVHAKSIGAVNISITSDNFEIIDNELGDVGVDSELRITGELRRPRIEGDVRIEAGRLEVDRLLQLFYDPYALEALPDVVSAERAVQGAGSAEEATRAALRRAGQAATPAEDARAEAGEDAPAPGGLMEPLALDVRLRIPDNLVLRGQDLRPGGPTGAALGDMNLTVGGDVRVRKDPGGRIALVGTVETIRGTYQFQGRRFDLVRGGTLRFAGSSDINPTLDVSATRLIPNTGVEARIQVTGSARAPELALTSNPPLDESDILSLIVFNRPVNELGTGERSSLAATAGGIATGFVASPLGESIGRALDLDLFEITTTTEEGDLGAGITVGQQVGDRAFVKLRQQFGERSLTEFVLEYQLYDFLRLQATAAPETSGSGNRLTQRRVERGGIDLIFFFSY